MDPALNIHSIETMGTRDGPGLRVVYFLQGCNLECLYCQNPDTQALTTDTMVTQSADHILQQLEKQRPYIANGGGVTFSGGEPTVQADALLQIIPQIQAAGFHVTLDTNAALYTPVVHQLYQTVDLVLFDLKHIDPDKYHRLTGGQLTPVLKNLDYLDTLQTPRWIRYVLVSGYNDQPEDIANWAQRVAQSPHVERVEIIPYHRLGEYKYAQLGRRYPLADLAPPSQSTIQQAAHAMQQYLPSVFVV